MKLVNPLTAIFHPPPTPGVLAVFGHLDTTVDAIGRLQAAGHTDLTVYSPIPRHEIEDALDQPVSPVRMFTLIGGISGCAIGAWLTLYMSYDWPLVLGGKPIGSVPPYVVIMFEMTILFGALSTILGILFNALFAARRLGTVAYDPRFTNDKFGIFVPSVVHRIDWFATMRHQRSIKPYARPIPPVPGTVPVTGVEPAMSLQTADRLVNPRTRTSESINRGRFVYETYCLVCHGQEGRGDGPISSAAGGPFFGVRSLVNDTIARRTDGYIYAVIVSGQVMGRGLMPIYGDKVRDTERWDLVNYVRTLQAAASPRGRR